jgi:hypothetical protein
MQFLFFFVSGRGIPAAIIPAAILSFDLFDLLIFWLFRSFVCRSFVFQSFCLIPNFDLLSVDLFVGRSFAVVPTLHTI